MQSDRQLKLWYMKYNKLYFNGQLPDSTVIYWCPSPGAHADTCPVFEVSDGVFEIKLDPAIQGNTKFWHQMLLHEMIHVALWPRHPKHQHGKLFQDEKARIYALGALKRLW